MTPNSSNDDDGFFNDLSRQPHSASRSTDSPEHNDEAPKTKRIACVICRKRKLKCDGNKPKCATCERLGHNCAYDEVRRKSGPKRGYVKDLEARLGWYLGQPLERNVGLICPFNLYSSSGDSAQVKGQESQAK